MRFHGQPRETRKPSPFSAYLVGAALQGDSGPLLSDHIRHGKAWHFLAMQGKMHPVLEMMANRPALAPTFLFPGRPTMTGQPPAGAGKHPLSRRSFLQIGSLGVAGLTLP